jgi:hypothetical protein
LKYQQNTTFRRDSAIAIAYDNRQLKFIPSAKLTDVGGNELVILRIHDPVRNRANFSFSFVDVLNRDFLINHSFSFDKPVTRDGVQLYCIIFKAVERATGGNHGASGKIFIEKSSYAIHKLEYQTFEGWGNDRQLLYDINLEYARLGKSMHPNYISFNNIFKVKNPLDFMVTSIGVNRLERAFLIGVNHPIDSSTVEDLGHYTLKVKDMALVLKDATLVSPTEILLMLAVNKKFDINVRDDELTRTLQIAFHGVRDRGGRELNEVSYLSVNQFREMFIQRTNVTIDNGNLTDFLVPVLPLASQKTSDAGGDTGYWMNTPLKKQSAPDRE